MRGLVLLSAAVILAGLVAAVLLIPQRPEAAIAPVDAGMAVIPGGQYSIGSNDGPALARPAHSVTVAPFGMETREVTGGRLRRLCRHGPGTGSLEPATRQPVAGHWCDLRRSDELLRVEARPGRTAAHGGGMGSGGAGHRRPPVSLEMEWDPAAANTESARRAGPAPVGSYPRGRTPEGVQDLIGNVWEWTMTQIAPYSGGPPIPNLAANTGSYVIRGGAFDTPDSTASPVTRGISLRRRRAPASTRPDSGVPCRSAARRHNARHLVAVAAGT